MERPTEEALALAVTRLAARDASLFTDPEIASDRLGWLGLAAEAASSARDVRWLASGLTAGMTDIVLLGMGGSSLAPLVLARVIGPAQDAPALHVLDTTDPAEVSDLLQRIDPETTFVVVSSKSGTSIETLALAAIFWGWATEALGAGAGLHFAAITDPGSPLEELAHARGYTRVVHAQTDVGGRFAAFTPFAIVPAAMIGIDIGRLAAFGTAVEGACHRPGAENPGQALATFLLDAYADGRDKLTLAFSSQFEPLGLWIEQLVAESTGKGGAGILPVIETAPFDARGRGTDRMTFVLRTGADASLADLAGALPAGEPVFEAVVDDPYAVGAQFVLWEWAIALFCAIAGIEPFDQPDVESAKQAARAIVDGGPADTGALVAETPFEVRAHLGRTPDSATNALRGLLDAARPGSYLALLAYLPEDASADIAGACARLASARRIPLTVETGPRYLHSTGQFHKGGPDGGLFLVVSAHDALDLPVPGETYTLATLHAAQAAGDIAALAARGRPVVAVKLPDTAPASIASLVAALESLS